MKKQNETNKASPIHKRQIDEGQALDRVLIHGDYAASLNESYKSLVEYARKQPKYFGDPSWSEVFNMMILKAGTISPELYLKIYKDVVHKGLRSQAKVELVPAALELITANLQAISEYLISENQVLKFGLPGMWYCICHLVVPFSAEDFY